jgi:hypothetical protein
MTGLWGISNLTLRTLDLMLVVVVVARWLLDKLALDPLLCTRIFTSGTNNFPSAPGCNSDRSRPGDKDMAEKSEERDSQRCEKVCKNLFMRSCVSIAGSDSADVALRAEAGMLESPRVE